MKQHLILLLSFFLLLFNASAKEQPKDNSLFFVENAGQITDQHHQQRKDIDYKLEANGVTLFVGNGQLHYQWVKSQNSKVKNEKDIDLNTELGNDSISIYRMDVTLVGANKDAKVLSSEDAAYYEQYYTRTNNLGAKAHSYKRITYQNIYPNIDWTLYVKDGQLKYDFIVHQGGNVADIQLQYDGATDLQLQNGALTATTPYGSITEAAPYTYTAQSNTPINSSYLLEGNMLSYSIATDIDEDIIIDPVLNWATYYGGAGEDLDAYIATDATGNAYLAGTTESTSNIATTGSYQASIIGANSIFLAKLNIYGQRQWCTYYDSASYTRAIDVSPSGEVYLAGIPNHASTMNLGTSGTFHPIASIAQGYVVKFNSSGQRLWHTYLSADSVVSITDISFDHNNHLIVLGNTPDTSIATPGTFRQTPGYGFLLKLNASGQRVWGTHSLDVSTGVSIDCDISGNTYITGTVINGITTGIATTGTHQTSHYNNGRPDGMLLKYSASGQKLWGTYLGGALYDRPFLVACDGNNAVYVAGYTESTNGIATTGALYTTRPTSAHNSTFLMKFNPNGTRSWGTYYYELKNSFNTLGYHLGLDVAKNGDVYFSGPTNESGLATSGAFKTAPVGYDVLISRISSSGQKLWASYFGGSNDESIHINNYANYNNTLHVADNYIYQIGDTKSPYGIATNGVHQTSLNAGTTTSTAEDLFLVQLGFTDTSVYVEPAFRDTTACVGDTLFVPFGVTNKFNSNNTFTIQLSNATGGFTSGTTTLATVSSDTSGIASCILPTSVGNGNGYKVRVIASAPADTSRPNTISINISNYPANFSTTTNAPVCTGDTLTIAANTTTTNTSFNWTGPNNYTTTAKDTTITNATVALSGDHYLTAANAHCVSYDTITVTVNPTPVKPTLASNAPICGGDTLLLSSSTTTTGVSYAWSGPGFTATQKDPMLLNAQVANSGVYTLTLSLGMCSISDTISVQVDPAATVSVVPTPGNDICEGTQVTFVAFTANAGTSPSFQWQKNGIDIAGANNNNYITTPANGDSYNVILSPNTTCKNDKVSNIVNMTITPVVTPSVSISNNPTLPVGPWTMVTFKATATNGGANPTFQWKRNGQDVVGATGDTWGTAQLNNNDVISVVLYSQHKCAVPDTAVSNAIDVLIDLGVDDITGGYLQLYPNPNSGSFTLKGEVANNNIIDMNIINELGQTVHQTTIRPQHNTIDQQVNINKELATGLYLLQLRTEDGVSTMKLHIQ